MGNAKEKTSQECFCKYEIILCGLGTWYRGVADCLGGVKRRAIKWGGIW